MDLHRRSVLTGLAAASFCPICSARAVPLDEYEVRDSTVEWDYSKGPRGPAHWGDLSPEFYACGYGAQQSPIALDKPTLARLPPLHIAWRPYPTKITNNGHTIMAIPEKGVVSSITEGGGPKYTLREFHFHKESEHTLDDKPFAMEAHFVHVNEIEAAATVLGVLIQPGGRHSDELQKIWNIAPAQGGVPGGPVSIDPNKLLPEGGVVTRYRYAGSLTTPGCAQIVNWNVARGALKVTQAQIDQFDTWYPHNARPVLPLGNRVLLLG